MYWRIRSRVWCALSFTAASTPRHPSNKHCYLIMSRTSLKTSLSSGVNRSSPHLPTGDRTRLAAAGSTPPPPVRGAHPAQFAGGVKDAVVDQVTGKAVNPLSFVINEPLPVSRQTIPTGSSLLPNVFNVTRRIASFRTALTGVCKRSNMYRSCLTQEKEILPRVT